jgi:hypothetical protein
MLQYFKGMRIIRYLLIFKLAYLISFFWQYTIKGYVILSHFFLRKTEIVLLLIERMIRDGHLSRAPGELNDVDRSCQT